MVVMGRHLLTNLFVSLSRIGCTFGVVLTVIAYDLELVCCVMDLVVANTRLTLRCC